MTAAHRYLAFDPGQRRIGVAFTDTSVNVIVPRLAIEVETDHEAVEEIIKLVELEKPEAVIIGWPLTMSGKVGPQAKTVGKLIEQLRVRLTCPVIQQDERLSSAAGRRVMPVGVKGDDSAAAAQILETFLQQQAL